MATSAIGVDIGTRTITVAEVKGGRGSTAVTNFGGVELSPDVVREGEEILVKCMGFERGGKIRLSRKEALGLEPTVQAVQLDL